MSGIVSERQSGIEINPDAINQSLCPHVPTERMRRALVALDIDQASCSTGWNTSGAKHGYQENGMFRTVASL